MIVSKWFQVLFHSDHLSSFHLSLTVLVHYRSGISIQGWIVVDPDSDRIPRVPPYSGYCQLRFVFRIRDYHPLWLYFPECSAKLTSCTLQSYNPSASTGFALLRFRSPLLTQSLLISFPEVLRCFNSLVRSYIGNVYLYTLGCPIRKSTDQSFLTAPVAYRSLVRPSSPLPVKASTIRSQQLTFLPFIIDSKTHHFLVKVFMIRLLYLKTESIQTLNIKLNDLVSTKL